MKSSLLIATCLLCTATSLAQAPAPKELKVMGGNASIKHVQAKEEEVKSKLGIKLIYIDGTAEKGAVALLKGLVDVASFAELPSETLKRMIAKTSDSSKVEDFDWIKYNEQTIYLEVNTSNSVETISDDQVSGILAGKFKHWAEVGGSNFPIVPCSASSSFVVTKTTLAKFNNGKDSPALQMVADQTGIINMLKREPGAACFTTSKIETPAFKAKHIATSARVPSYFVFRKNAPKQVREFTELYVAK